jgi:hypothetical protein
VQNLVYSFITAGGVAIVERQAQLDHDCSTFRRPVAEAQELLWSIEQSGKPMKKRFFFTQLQCLNMKILFAHM